MNKLLITLAVVATTMNVAKADSTNGPLPDKDEAGLNIMEQAELYKAMCSSDEFEQFKLELMIDAYYKFGDDTQFKAITVDVDEERQCLGAKMASLLHTRPEFTCLTWCMLARPGIEKFLKSKLVPAS